MIPVHVLPLRIMIVNRAGCVSLQEVLQLLQQLLVKIVRFIGRLPASPTHASPVLHVLLVLKGQHVRNDEHTAYEGET